MTDSEQAGEVFSKDFLDELDNPVFAQWMRAHNAVVDLLECEMLEADTQKEVNVVTYTDKMRDNIRETVQRSAFDDPRMQELASDSAMTVEQVLERARKLAQSSATAERDAKSAASIIRIIKGFDTR